MQGWIFIADQNTYHLGMNLGFVYITYMMMSGLVWGTFCRVFSMILQIKK